MVLIGALLVSFYFMIAYLGYRVLLFAWITRPDPLTLGLALIIATATMAYLSYRFGTARLLASLQARELSRSHAPRLYQRFDALCDWFDLAQPQLLIADLGGPNALAIGAPGNGVVVLDQSLLQLLSMDELTGILAHELVHLESNDGFVQTLAYTGIQTVVAILQLFLFPVVALLVGLARGTAWILGRPVTWTRNPFAKLRYLLWQVMLGLLVLLTLPLLAYSRRREYAADDRAASATGDPLTLARALTRIKRATDPVPGLQSLLYIYGEEDAGLPEVFSTHPPMESRIGRLLERAHREGHLRV